MATRRVQRTSRRTRLFHTGVYLTTLALLLTGWWLWGGGEGRPSPLARLAGVPDARLHVWLGWGLAAALALPLLLAGRSVVAFVRETVRVDRGDARWWRSWPAAVFSGRFARHEGHFDPGQRVANVVLLGGLMTLVATGTVMTRIHGGPLFVWLARIHLWTTIVITPVIAGHVLIALGVLPGYRGVWRAMHLGGRVREDTASRLWPGWAERSRTSVPPATAELERPPAPQTVQRPRR
jgi:formate dehydrogenase subunit gamma